MILTDELSPVFSDDMRPLITALFLMLATSASAQPLTVDRIVDGDTFELSDGRTVRLIGIDTPEVHESAKLRRDAERTNRDAALIQDLGKKASRHAALLALGQPVELAYDQANAHIDHADRYGRTLAYVWVLGTATSRSFCVNERMVAEGYAYAYTRYPFSRLEEYRAHQRRAREQGRGLWSDAAAKGAAGLTISDEGEAEVRESRTKEPDRDCGHFSSHADAQQFFERTGGAGSDPHRLDSDSDGVACESLR